MFILKNKYYLIIENIKDIDLKNIKVRNKFFIIYRSKKKSDNFNDLFRFRQKCRLKAVQFYVANNVNLAVSLNSLALISDNTLSIYSVRLAIPYSSCE